jgi:hypothetical protein
MWRRCNAFEATLTRQAPLPAPTVLSSTVSTLQRSFALLPFVHRAALSVSEDPAQRSAPMSHMRDQSSGRDVILRGENPLNGLK